MSAAGNNPDERAEGGVTEALRSAIERTLQATSGPAVGTRERAGELLDEVVRRGREAGDEIARRGHDARDELSRRGQDARGEVARQLETLERRLAAIEERLGREADRARHGQSKPGAGSNPRSKG